MPKTIPVKYGLSGSINNVSDQPLSRVTVVAYRKEADGTEHAIGTAKTDKNGKYYIPFVHGQDEGTEENLAAPDVFIRVFSGNEVVQESPLKKGIKTKASINMEIDDSRYPGLRNIRTIKGRLFLENKLEAANVKLSLFRTGFGGESLITTATTDANGIYQFEFASDDVKLAYTIYATRADGTTEKLMDVKYSTQLHEDVNLLASNKVLASASEYKRLLSDLSPELNGKALSEASEKGEKQDISYLYEQTGWDSRLITMAAMADKASKDTGMAPELLYALFRTGLPSQPDQLARISQSSVKQAIAKSNASGLTQLDTEKSIASFAEFSIKQLGTSVMAGGIASVADFCAKAGLKQDEQAKISDIFFKQDYKGAEIWEKAKQAGLPDSSINKLKVQGKLSFLTLNNAALAAQIQNGIEKPEDVKKLAADGFYKKENWKKTLETLAAGDTAKLESLIPANYVGKELNEKLDAYVSDMARKVKAAYPTESLSAMIKSGDMKLGKEHAIIKDDVSRILMNAAAIGDGFTPGGVSLKAYVSENKEALLKDIPEVKRGTALEAMKKLTRLYQVSPTDDAMQVLYDLGFTSAMEISSIPYGDWMKYYGPKFKTKEEATTVYTKSEQTTTMVYNFYTAATQLNNTVAPPATNSTPQETTTVKNNLVKVFPTLETLFGSMDYCECDHCRSVLSPAAYLVDILKFLDPDDTSWNRTKALYKEKHQADYTKPTPFTALKTKRPDLGEIALNCDNTNVAMPYIDIVNEILEAYIIPGATPVYDNTDLTSPELIAEPQNILSAAYKKLNESVYPFNLPFDYPVELTRKFCDYFELPFWKLLKTFRKSDDLTGTSVLPYYWNEIFMEYLGLAPAEQKMYTAPDFANWFSYYGYASLALATTKATDAQTQTRIDLLSAKTLSRKLGISYKELTEVIKTSFVNPALDNLVILKTLKLTVTDIYRWKEVAGYTKFTADEKADFDSLVTAGTTTTFNAKNWLEKLWTDKSFDKALLLFDTGSESNFDEATLQFADKTPLTSLEWIKLNLFVRLWKKLGWKMEEMDYALTSFMPKDVALSTSNFGVKFKTALLYTSHVKQLQENYSLGKLGLQKWISLWGRLEGGGNKSIYALNFLTAAIRKEDPVYTSPVGKYLSFQSGGNFVPFTFNSAVAENTTTGNVGLKNHIYTVQGALNLKEEEITLVLKQNDADLSTAALNLANLQLLHGYSLLHQVTGLTVKQVISLEKLTGLKPLRALPIAPVSTMADDHPYSQTIRFMEIATRVKESGFTVDELDFIVRHAYDPVGPQAPNEKNAIQFILDLSQDLKTIASDNTPPADITGYTDEFLQEKLVLALSADVANRFIGMWNNSYTHTVSLASAATQLPADLFDTETAVVLSYDSVLQLQQLSYTGVPHTAVITALKAIVSAKAALPAADPDAIDAAEKTLAENLLDLLNSETRKFYADHIFKTIFRQAPAYDFDQFFPVVNSSHTEAQQTAMRNTKKAAIGERVLDYLVSMLSDEAVINRVKEKFDIDESLIRSLLTDTSILQRAAKTYQASYLDVKKTGVTVSFINNETTGATSGPSVDKSEFILKGTEIPATTALVRFDGRLQSTYSGYHRFYLRGTVSGAQVKLVFTDFKDPVIDASFTVNNDEKSGLVKLQAGMVYQYRLEVRNHNNSDFTLDVQTETIPRQNAAALKLIPQSLITRITELDAVMTKSVRLITGFGLEEKELKYLCQNPTHYYQLHLSELPVRTLDTAVATDKVIIEKLFTDVMRMFRYTGLRTEMFGDSPELVDMIGMIRDNTTATLDSFLKLFALNTRRDYATVDQVVKYFGFSASSFTETNALYITWEALKTVNALGLATVTIASVTNVIAPAAAFDQRFNNAVEFKNSLKAAFSKDNWLRVAQAVYDKIRPMQRDALCAEIMRKEGFQRQGQLFEHFLVDPGMEPVVQTSRIRLAISSVQTFVQRCLLNLESNVSPSIIGREQWEWMKRYRVWEANRKIFLFPENWLEPEFRDDKTHLFKELESTLVKGEINREVVEKAFFEYLKGLEKISRLNMVAMYCEEAADLANNTIHVVGKSYTQPSYYYRTYNSNMWTPWVPIPDQIEGEHLALIKWQDRLHIFWLTFLPRAESKQSDSESARASAEHTTPDLMKYIVDIQLNWCEYADGEWRSRETGGFENSFTCTVGKNFNAANVYVHASIEYDKGWEKAVRIHVKGDEVSGGFRLVSKLAHPTSGVSNYIAPSAPPFAGLTPRATKYTGSGAFIAKYEKSLTTIVTNTNGKKGKTVTPYIDQQTLLTTPARVSLLFPNDAIEVSGDPAIDSMISPFFFEDNEASVTLYVEPEVTEKTVVTWEEWIIKEETKFKGYDDDYWKELPVKPGIPRDKEKEFEKYAIPDKGPWINPKDEVINPGKDWLLDETTVIKFGDSYIGAKGGLVLETLTKGTDSLTNGEKLVDISTGISHNGGMMVMKERDGSMTAKTGSSGLGLDVTSVNVIGAGGMTKESLNRITAGMSKAIN